jgi:hypothetical protein
LSPGPRPKDGARGALCRWNQRQFSRATGDDTASLAGGRIWQLHLQRNDVGDPPIIGLYGANATALRWRRHPAGRRTNPMAALINPPQRDLLEYLSDTPESADVRAGSPLPLGTQESGGGVNFAIFSRNASRVRLELFNHRRRRHAHRGSLTLIQHAIAPAMSGTFG